MSPRAMRVAVVTGGSRGLGLALARSLSLGDWLVIIDGRSRPELEEARADLARHGSVRAVAGDVADASHRQALLEEVVSAGRLDLLVNNASHLGPSPRPDLLALPIDELRRVLEVNVLAPLALTQLLVPRMSEGGVLVNVTSDAAVEAYAGWGGYGASKAALEQISRVLAIEHPALRIYWVDPGDMNTRMQQEAFPGEDISDRPPPEVSVPGLMALAEGNLPSGRYRARDVPLP